MGVYIKGMGVPERGDLHIVITSSGFVEDKHGFVLDDVVAVPVPPHGRLIDEKDICDKIRPLIENPYCYNRLQVISETLGSCLQIVRDAPTVIPAEEGET